MNIANKITLARVILIPVFCFFLMYDKLPGWSKWVAMGIFIVASLTDFVDGKVARKYNMVSNFGKFMDPLADKLLVCTALICLLYLGKINVYLVLIIIARDFIINGFRTVASDNGVVIAASWWGKVKTAAQMVMIVLLIADIEQLAVVNIVLEWIVLVLTVYSLCDYLVRNRNVLKEPKKEDN
ncbi:MAG: CDP-diacylglycerol--glycerol-3-phosphate 3-phosphatidyltransferase [Lachnospiraceae bacterium]|nr:CDP-diacylglycerol--glycerol-3-phosphate 3-phosphatidyltransferase [Lachnospiraceae bacterium]